MSNITLELRETDSTREYNNGDWESQVEPQTIYEGDQIVMRNVFIDTQATSNDKINVSEDLTLDLEYIYYYNFYLPNTQDGNFFLDQIGGGGVTPDDKTKLHMKGTVLTKSTNGTKAIFKIDMAFVANSPQGKVCPAFDFEINYTDVNNNPASIKVHNPSFTNKSPGAQIDYLPHIIFFKSNGDPTYEGLTFTPSVDEMKSKFGVFPTLSGAGLAEDEIVFEPVKGKTTISLGKGSYSPPDLCNTINTELTKIIIPQGAKNLYPSNGNQFLISQRLIAMDTGARETPFITGLQTKSNTLIGASKVELSYIDAQQKFSWDMLHTPMYDEDGVESVRYNSDALTEKGKVQKQLTGIIFTFLGAKNSNGDYFDFWSGLLGFNLQSLYPQVSNQADGGFWEYTGQPEPFLGLATDPSAPSFCTVIQPSIDYQMGNQDNNLPLQATGGLATIDALVPKGKQFSFSPNGADFFLPIPDTGSDSIFFSPTNGVNTRILAQNSVLGATSQFGYFVIEVTSKFRNDVIGSNINKNNVVGIVGRYYEVNSYTSGTTSDSIIYVHNGSPVILDSFKCRILDSNKDLAKNLGSDNTIFLQINRGEAYTKAQLPEILQNKK